MDTASPSQLPGISPERALEHLNAVLGSPFFATSKRCQEFLRYIVQEAIEGRAESINERNIAYGVFGKGINFEPGEDSLVRVKAREVRKRLADYYQSTAEDGVRIDLPLGGYVPLISCSQEPSALDDISHERMATRAAKPFDRRRFAWILGSSLGALGIASITSLFRRHETQLDLLWKPIFATKTPLLIFVPILVDSDGELSDRVGIGPAETLQRAAEFLTKHGYPYYVRFGANMTYDQLREQPSLILGGFSSKWTLMMTRDLPFSFETDDATMPRPRGQIIEMRTKKIWKPVNETPHGYAEEDYGILSRLFDPVTRQIVLVAGGITTFGTEGAASVFFDSELFSDLLKDAPRNWETKNFQAVIHVSIIGTTPSAPRCVAAQFW